VPTTDGRELVLTRYTVRIRAGPPCEKVGCVADCPYGRT
jgi:hypothetical protein